MFPAGFFAKSFFAGTYWAPADGGSIIVTEEVVHSIGRMVNMGTMMGRR
jgi:hypothetical protein